MSQDLPIGQGAIDSCIHCANILLTFGRSNGRAGQFTIRYVNTKARGSLGKHDKIVRTDLMPQPTGAAMDGNDDLAFPQAKRRRRSRIVNFFHPLDFNSDDGRRHPLPMPLEYFHNIIKI